jgi:hypothetical protein
MWLFHRFRVAGQAGCRGLQDGWSDQGLSVFVVFLLVRCCSTSRPLLCATCLQAELPNIQCMHDTAVDELMRGIRLQLDSLLSGLSPADAKAMRLGACPAALPVPSPVSLLFSSAFVHSCRFAHGSVRSLLRAGLSHSLSRYKLKMSPDKVDTMIIQAICE